MTPTATRDDSLGGATATPNPTADQGPDVTDLPDTGGGPTDATQSGFAWTIAALLAVFAFIGGRVAISRRKIDNRN